MSIFSTTVACSSSWTTWHRRGKVANSMTMNREFRRFGQAAATPRAHALSVGPFIPSVALEPSARYFAGSLPSRTLMPRRN